MTKKVVGPTGDYSTWALLLAALPDPLTDDYEFEVQAGTYNEEMSWDIDNNGYTAKVYPTPGTEPIFDAQATRSYAYRITDGVLDVEGTIRFRDATDANIRLELTSGGPVFRGCILHGAPISVRSDFNDNQDTRFYDCLIEDFTDRGFKKYRGAGMFDVRGCLFRFTGSGINPYYAFELSMDYDGTNGQVRDCRMQNWDGSNGVGAAIAFVGGAGDGGAYIRDCRLIEGRLNGAQVSTGSATHPRLYGFYAIKSSGGSAGWFNGGSTDALLLRCFFDGFEYGIRTNTAGGYVKLRNSGIINCNNAARIDAGTTMDNDYNGLWNNTSPFGGSGTYNQPESNGQTGDPKLNAASSLDGIGVDSDSPWINVGEDDGLPKIQANPDIGPVQHMPARLIQNA